ncbi:19895_t:CDS:1 [Racocetra persica]|uniref:19895_t:CDS:1 n=1 Tax=Racocetra persica TaxID=160502 RepID=A0ACA9L3C2_9GLOM|nr:19895_t:CDS:1 [Racocetra persica]
MSLYLLECWNSIPDQRPTIEEIVSKLENINIDNVISVDEAELEDDGDNNKLVTTNIIQKLISEIDDDSEVYRSLNEALSSASNVKTLSTKTSNSTSKIEVLNSASNIEALNFKSNVDEALNVTSNIDKALNSTLNINKNFITNTRSKNTRIYR